MRHYIVDAFVFSWAVLVLVDNLYLRRKIRQRKREDAERTVEALGNTVLVDGMQLPKPDDPRWEKQERKVKRTVITFEGARTRSEPVACLSFGPVVMDAENWVWVNGQSFTSDAMKRYAGAKQKQDARGRVIKEQIGDWRFST